MPKFKLISNEREYEIDTEDYLDNADWDVLPEQEKETLFNIIVDRTLHKSRINA